MNLYLTVSDLVKEFSVDGVFAFTLTRFDFTNKMFFIGPDLLNSYVILKSQIVFGSELMSTKSILR